MHADIVATYLAKITDLYKTGQTTEHSFRPALQDLFNAINPDLQAVNEPKGIKVGRPDFVFLRRVGGATLTVGHCEAKDLKFGIDPKELKDANKDQYNRYVKALPNLIYTNGVDFDFYKSGVRVRQISIADFLMGIHEKPDQFAVLANQLKDFAAERLQTVTHPEQLAEMMAGKAVLIKDVLFNSLKEDANLKTELAGQYKAFKDQLIHDLTLPEFADLYAETVTYGLFGARLHDESLETFTRREALELLPKSNPFLRQLFGYVAGQNLEENIARTIDELAEIFQATNLPKLFENFGSFTQRNDPFIDFYENFLAAYNPAKRKARGVWYTPEPVVNFIVRAVDDVLKSEFELADGLADTSKIVVDWDTGQNDPKTDKPRIEKREMHRVQILDPAAGTGTFLAEVIKQIAPKVRDVAPGQWNKYVEEELIPRLHGFELLMASYAMCHMKLDMTLTKFGYRPTANPPRLGVYLTNTLEQGERVKQDLPFANWLSAEAKGANTVKRDVPVMCIIGNPPYSVSSSNKGAWIEGLMATYKENLDEKNIQPLSDDYVKFLKFSQHMIEKNGCGVVGFITNNSYLDGVIHRVMRGSLQATFNKIYVLDLHGNSNKRERCPDGSVDQNVFDIQQGVSIIILIKTKKTTGSVVYKEDIYGKRDTKYSSLTTVLSERTALKKIDVKAPYHLFMPFGVAFNEYAVSGFNLDKLFATNLSGIVTGNDKKFVAFRSAELRSNDVDKKPFLFRPLDQRILDYDVSRLQRARDEIMRHLIVGDNFALIVPRQSLETGGASVTNIIAGHKTFSAYNRNYIMPLYLYETIDQTRRVNMDPKIRQQIEDKAEHLTLGRPDEVAIFDYIYGVLHCPAYRSTYAEFLKIDFPRVPWPASPDAFWDIAAKGTQLRRLHLMEDAAIGATPFKFTGDGDSAVEKPEYLHGNVYINKTQCFENVPAVAWSFFIGGYQPAQKWLKDRKGRTLNFEDIKHYQKIIKILSETDRIMETIEMELA